MAATDSAELSGCIRMNPKAVADQSVLRKQGFPESKRANRGELTISCFSLSKRETRSGVQRSEGIGRRWNLDIREQNGLMDTSNHGQNRW
jgi:hypothetical protein